jgi:hypothetical protein
VCLAFERGSEGSAKLVVFKHPNARERIVPLSASIQN